MSATSRLVKEDIRLYFTDGHLIFSKPVAGRRDRGGLHDGRRGRRRRSHPVPARPRRAQTLATYIHSPNLDEHFKAARLALHRRRVRAATPAASQQPGQPQGPRDGRAARRGMDARPAQSRRQLPDAPHARSARRTGPARRHLRRHDLQRQAAATSIWSTIPTLPTRSSPARSPPARTASTSIPGPASSRNPRARIPPESAEDVVLRDYRIEATVAPTSRCSATTHVKVRPKADGDEGGRPSTSRPQMEISDVTVDGRPAECAPARIAAAEPVARRQWHVRRGPARAAARRTANTNSNSATRAT